MKAALLFDHFGPYHQARLLASACCLDVTGVECHSLSKDYAWIPSYSQELPLISLSSTASIKSVALGQDRHFSLENALESLHPDVVAIPGWSSAEALTALQWCSSYKVPAILMSESCAHDEVRIGWKEWIKRRVVSKCSAALVGGSSHRDYLIQLGFSANRIFLGYDAVDNDHFRCRATTDSATKFCSASFLACARFIPKKNLFRLIDAYSIYRFKKCNNSGVSPWDLTLLGDGDLRHDLECVVRSLGLQEHIKMPGFKQYDELPAYYKEARVFIHASTTEQWGLVVNEAMASGLPVLVSSNCGCTRDLVHEGVNGFSFDPYDPEALAKIMFRMTTMSDEDLLCMGRASEEIIADWGPQRFSRGLLDAAQTAQSVGICRMGLLDRMLVKILSLR